MPKNINIFDLLTNAEQIIESQRETLTEEQKKEFDEKLKESDFHNLKENLAKQLNSLGDQLSKLSK